MSSLESTMTKRIHSGSISYLNKVASGLRMIGYRVVSVKRWSDKKETWVFEDETE